MADDEELNKVADCDAIGVGMAVGVGVLGTGVSVGTSVGIGVLDGFAFAGAGGGWILRLNNIISTIQSTATVITASRTRKRSIKGCFFFF